MEWILSSYKAIQQTVTGSEQKAHLELFCDAALEDFHIIAGSAPGPCDGNSSSSPVVLLELSCCLGSQNQGTHTCGISEEFVKRQRHKVWLSLSEIQRMTGRKLGCIHQDPPMLQFSSTTGHFLSPSQGEDLTREVLFCRVREPGTIGNCTTAVLGDYNPW